MKTGLFFGSFNPIHLGHLAIAQYVLNETDIQKIRFIVSPRNPLKPASELMDAELRLDMVKLSVADNPDFEVSDIEFGLPTPSYTAQTLDAISAGRAKGPFVIIMGSDTLQQLPQWKSPEKILQYPILVYKRSRDIVNPYPEHGNIEVADTPLLDISSSRIRQLLREKKEVKYLVRDEILNLLKFN